MPLETREFRRRAAREFAAVSVLVYVVACAVLVVPGFFLATGVQAVGASLGWWAGDPDAQGGEELVGTAVGIGSALLVLGVAAVVMRALGRRYLMPARLAVVVGSAVVLVGLVTLSVVVVLLG
ncbi:hypothetical protein [Pseudolysinimonas sp.]|jgi:hypothetical protein|uniref:hypothetical protein n=1 Tax=Pseudolysinimonas sp. TaxID=2680009 RepID=UPI003783BDF5